MTNSFNNKEQIEIELLLAQKEKVFAEIAVLRKTTPFTESIKIFGSMVLGIGGAVAAFAGFQLAEVKAEKYKLEAITAEQTRDKAKIEYNDLVKRLELVKKDYSLISDKIADAQQHSVNSLESNTLQELQQNINAADIDLRVSLPTTIVISNDSLDDSIEKLFNSKASIRGNAYEIIMSNYSSNPALVPRLLEYAEKHMENQNGVYNTIIVFSNIDSQLLTEYSNKILLFANKARSIGSKTNEKVNKLLEKLVH